MMRKTGIDKIKVDGVELELGALPESTSKKAHKLEDSYDQDAMANIPVPLPDPIETEELTEEQLLNWSADPGGMQLGPGEQI